MSDAKVKFFRRDRTVAVVVGEEQTFDFSCPKYPGRWCGGLFIKGRTELKHDPQGKNGGIAQWDWDGNRDAPTFTPSINCMKCWHGYIRAGRCVDTSGRDEP